MCVCVCVCLCAFEFARERIGRQPFSLPLPRFGLAALPQFFQTGFIPGGPVEVLGSSLSVSDQIPETLKPDEQTGPPLGEPSPFWITRSLSLALVFFPTLAEQRWISQVPALVAKGTARPTSLDVLCRLV